MKRVFGRVEAVFDGCYLAAAMVMGLCLLLGQPHSAARTIGGVMALVLAAGDAFHLAPRMALILTGQEERLRIPLGRGKQITSVTMTVFYVLLWALLQSLLPVASPRGFTAAVLVLAAVRAVLCLLPQNRWTDRYPPVSWSVLRNVPFFLLGLAVAGGFYAHRAALPPSMGLMWLAILLSFLFYLPVVLWAGRCPKVGMLMLPKTCAYVWMLGMCFV